MGDGLDTQGHWWLPGRQDEPVPGRLSFDVATGGELELIGALEHPFRPRGSHRPFSAEYGMVHGTAGAECFTLVDCFRVNVTGQVLSDTVVETVHVNLAIEGLLFNDDEMIGGDGLSATMTHLPQWMGTRTLHRNHRSAPEDPSRWSIAEATRMPPIEVELNDGSILTIDQLLSEGGDGVTEVALRQDFRAKITSLDIRPLDDLIGLLGTFQDLVSIAADDAAQYRQVHLWRPEAQWRGKPFGCRVHAQWNDRADEKPRQMHQPAFTWRQVATSEALSRWMDTGSRFRKPLQRVMASRWRQGLFLDDRLLHRCAALEALDRVRTGFENSKFKARLARCVEVAGPPFVRLVGDPVTWAEAMRVERDEVAHQFGQLPHDTARLLFLSDSAYWLFVLCMLREADMPPSVIDGVTSSQGWQWVDQNLRSTLGV